MERGRATVASSASASLVDLGRSSWLRGTWAGKAPEFAYEHQRGHVYVRQERLNVQVVLYK